jgi:hypothetical protein
MADVNQRALIVRTGPDGHDGLDELNIELRRGWRVVEVAPMGGAAVDGGDGESALCVAALVIIEDRSEPDAEPAVAAEVMEQEPGQEEPEEELVEEVVEEMDEGAEGDGANPPAPGIAPPSPE